MSYFVYEIEIAGTTRYIGYTENPQKREKQHNYLCYKKNKSKQLYQKIRDNHNDVLEIRLAVVKEFKSKIDAKRWECLMILEDYFNERRLWQQVPRISDM